MNSDKSFFGKCYGTATLGERGQVVIPVEARKLLELETGSKLLVYQAMGGVGLFLVKADVLEQFVRTAMERLAAMNEQIRETNVEENA